MARQVILLIKNTENIHSVDITIRRQSATDIFMNFLASFCIYLQLSLNIICIKKIKIHAKDTGCLL